MKFRTPIFMFLALTISVGGLFSCKKQQEATTVAGKLQGRWKLTKFAPDNGASPLVYTPIPASEDWEWVFNGSTGYDIESWDKQEGIREVFSYKVTGDSLWVGTATHDTATYFVSEINAVDMIWTRSDMQSNGTKVTRGYYFSRN